MPSKTCAREGCDVVFKSYPSQNKKYCSNDCRYACAKYRDNMKVATDKHSITEVDEDLRRGTCTICGANSPIRRRDNGRWRCNVPTQIHERLRRYNLSYAEYMVMYQLQTGRCAICRKEFIATPAVDHDHSCCSGNTSCGKCVRGLLCTHCNKGLSGFRDNPEYMLLAIQYLQS